MPGGLGGLQRTYESPKGQLYAQRGTGSAPACELWLAIAMLHVARWPSAILARPATTQAQKHTRRTRSRRSCGRARSARSPRANASCGCTGCDARHPQA
eukprot:8053148-Alexandrium_andersonii.AAC.1